MQVLLALACLATATAFSPAAVRVGARRHAAAASATRVEATVAGASVPHGGTLVNLFVEDKAAAAASCTVEHQLTDRQLCDVELIANGGFSPLTGFMDEATYVRRRGCRCCRTAL